MSAESAFGSEAALGSTRARRPAAELLRWAALSLTGLLALAAVVLCWRRLDAGLSRPLGLDGLVAAGAMVALLAASARAAWHYSRAAGQSTRFDRIMGLSISAAVLALGAAVSLPGTSAAGLALFWTLLALEEFWAWKRGGGFFVPFRMSRPWPLRTGKTLTPRPAPSVPLPPEAESPPGDADVLQQLTRSRTADGGESLSGWLRVSLAAGQRNTSVHVAFCPPFVRTPKATLEQLDGPEARIKTVQLLPYGARFDLKLASTSATGETLLLQLSALAKPPQASEG